VTGDGIAAIGRSNNWKRLGCRDRPPPAESAADGGSFLSA
jgi:hypothetical protein